MPTTTEINGAAASSSSPAPISTGIMASVNDSPSLLAIRPVANAATRMVRLFTARSMPAQICERVSRSRSASRFFNSKYTNELIAV